GKRPLDLDIARDPAELSSASLREAQMDKPSKRLEALEAEIKMLKDEVKNLAKKK
ncbi:hypothetical protein KI387_039163, partial [Taxus chinensis]